MKKITISLEDDEYEKLDMIANNEGYDTVNEMMENYVSQIVSCAFFNEDDEIY